MSAPISYAIQSVEADLKATGLSTAEIEGFIVRAVTMFVVDCRDVGMLSFEDAYSIMRANDLPLEKLV